MLFEVERPQDTSPVDNTNITTTLLYFSDEELAEFKKLCKTGMLKEYGDERFTKANLSDFLLLLLRNNYANTNG